MSRQFAIAKLNDLFRSRLGVPAFGSVIPGRFVFTSGIRALPANVQIDIWMKVRSFDHFTEDNDPFQEHDFGAIEIEEAGTIFWKIDYFDPSYEMGSDDPTDLTKTSRVLTVMLAEEW